MFLKSNIWIQIKMISIAIVFIDLIVWNMIVQPEISAKICGDRSTNESHCCPGYRWDKAHENCTPCEVGYYGLDCGDECPSPYYGYNCKSKCNCTEKNCHHVYGCELSQGDFRDDSTSITYEWRTLIVKSTQEKQQIKESDTDQALDSIVALVIVSVILITMILCTYLWKIKHGVLKRHKETTPSV